MTLQAINGGHWIGPRLSSSVVNFHIIDDTGEKAAVVFKIPLTGSLTDIGFFTRTVVQCTNGLDIRLEDVSLVDGNPDGNLQAVNTEETGQAVVSNTWYWSTLNAAANVTEGDLQAAVFQFNNFQAGDDVDIALKGMDTVIQYPYSLSYVGAAWTKTTSSINIGLKYSGGVVVYLPGAVIQASHSTRSTWNSGSGNIRRGLRFQLPYPARLRSVGAYIDMDEDVKIIVYDSDGIEGNALYTSAVLDKDVRGTADRIWYIHEIPSASRPTIAKDTYYRVAVVPQDTTNITLEYHNFSATADLDSWPGGQEFHWTQSNTDPPVEEADWDQTLTRVPFINLEFDQFDDGAGAGAGGGGAKMINIPGLIL